MINASKDFEPIADDYGFFMNHSTEAENDITDYQASLETFVIGEQTISMLDFGCGSGDFTYRFLECTRWSPEQLRLALIEPVENQRFQAAERLQRFTDFPVKQEPKLHGENLEGFDIILSNHVFYYVMDLETTLVELIGALNRGGLLLVSIAGRDNTLFPIWEKGFAAIGQPVPYWLAEDVDAMLRKIGVQYSKEPSRYELIFPDLEENRMKILRFLCADHFITMPEQELLPLFDTYARNDRIEMYTHSTHFMIGAAV